MTAKPTDPDPENTPGLEPGGGVMPGDTPPGEASTSGVSHQEPGLPSGRSQKIVYGVILGFAALVVVMLAGYAIGIGR
ncbi:DUF6480 family protein [Cellulomonas cellasea]|uniref:Uncharacterized protein n=1 Tax=Cellulomonas cellasea TaxID=43670 RepID=A0A7W4UGY9_9CELL|nr:DUF6480 family protein [Cellulomonas cellasea]MBB2923388.1 hypothetical protein [Cellulomonas cellasea]